TLHVVLEAAHDLGARHVAIRIGAVILGARHTEIPVRRDERERVPAFIAPGVSGLRRAFEDDMLPPALRQVIAERQPRLPAADDDGFDVLRHGKVSRLKSTRNKSHRERQREYHAGRGYSGL